jgi:protoporphyrinogen oxidase
MRRRAFLAASTAAAGAGALACRRRRRGLPFEGELIGPAVEVGHAMRDLQLPSASTFEPVDVVIVGGGIAGLSAAWRLLGQGYRSFVVLELEEAAGGTARSGRNHVGAFPWGAHYIPAPSRDNPALVRLFQECGLLESNSPGAEPVVKEQFLVRAPEERIFAYGQWWEGLYLRAGASLDDEAQHTRFFEEVNRLAGWRDARGRRAFAIPRAKCSDDPEMQSLDRQSFMEWLQRRKFTSSRLYWMLDYACRDDYGSTLETTSAWAGLFYYCARKQLRREGDGQAPVLEDSHPLVAWPEGNGFIVDHLAKACEGKLRLGHAVTTIRRPTDGLLHVHAYDVKAKAAVGFQARKVIFAGPQHVANHVIPSLWEARPEGLNDFIQSPWLVANLTLRQRPEEHGFPLAWDNVLRDSPSLGYVVASHQAMKDHGPAVFTYYYPFPGQDVRESRSRLMAMDWKACAQLVVEDLRKAHPDIEKCIARLDVMRWGHAMVRPRPGFCWSVALAQAREPVNGIHFAHTDLSGLALFEEAQDHGLRAAEEVLAALGYAAASWR